MTKSKRMTEEERGNNVWEVNDRKNNNKSTIYKTKTKSIMNLQILEQQRRERLKDRNQYGQKLPDIQITILHQYNKRRQSKCLKDRNRQS